MKSESTEEYKRYKLYAIDSEDNLVIIKETETIYELDCYTFQYDNRIDMINKLKKEYGKEFKDFFIESKVRKKEETEQGKIIIDIIYFNNVIPAHDELCDIYTDYLLEDKNRIKESFGYYMPRHKNKDLSEMNPDEFRIIVKKRIKSYKKMREVYFELLKNNKIKLVISKNQIKNLYLHAFLKEIDENFEGKDIKNMTEEELVNLANNMNMARIIEDYKNKTSDYEFEDSDSITKFTKGSKR